MTARHFDWREEVRRRLRIDVSAEREHEIFEEIAHDLEQQFDALISRGVPESAARRQLLSSLDDRSRLSHNIQRVEPRSTPSIGLLHDARLAVRVFVRDPLFAGVSVLTLAVGVGVNLAIFTLAYAALWRPLPFVAPDRLVEIHERRPNGAAATYTSLPNYQDWRIASSFTGMAAYTDTGATLTDAGDPVRLDAVQITTTLLPLIGVEPMLGRNFTNDEDRRNGGAAVILSHDLWAGRFGSDPAIIGRSVTIDGHPHPVVGVTPKRFQFPVRTDPVDLYLPLGRDPFPQMQLRDGRLVRVVARVGDGVTVAKADAEMAAIAGRLGTAYPDSNKGWGAFVVPLQQDWFGSSRQGLLMLLGAVAFVLLIACANLASLVLARLASRQRDMAVRRALGASRFRLVQQVMVQSLVVSIAGGLVGLILSVWLRGLVIAAAPPSLLRLSDAALDAPALGAALAITLFVGLVVGIGPAWMTSGNTVLSTDRGSAGGARHNRFLNVLLVVEIAAAIILLSGATLFTQSLGRVLSVDPGFDPSGVIAVPIDLPARSYSEATRQSAFYGAVLDRLTGIPGVESAAAAFPLPLEGPVAFPFSIDGQTQPERPVSAFYRTVSAQYFSLLKVPLIRGRLLSTDDRATSVPVVVINEAMAAASFRGEDPLGRRITIVDRNAGDVRTSREIVGVVGNVRHQGLDRASGPEMYVPYEQAPSPWMSVLVRGPEAERLQPRIAAAIHAVDSALPVQNAHMMEQRLERSSSQRRFGANLLGALAVSAILLTLLGIASTTAYVVGRRTPEIAVRIALGASMPNVFRLILTGTTCVAATGIVLGLAASVALSRTVRGLLFQVDPLDPFTLAAVSIAMLALALLAGIGPARRAAAIDPVVALRSP